jgi:tryptophanyl-tRNA synthetase
MKRIVTGVRATGPLHIGNYFGALKHIIELQSEPNTERYLFIADYHTLTTVTNPRQLQKQVLELGKELLAVGIDPKKTTIFLQSGVPEIAELSYLLGNVALKGELERVATFKEKARRQPQNVNLALLMYPALMAADVLGIEATDVPVGEDQYQHMEMVRDFAKRFNQRYAPTFVVPRIYRHDRRRVQALDGSGKMGKSEGNTIGFMTSKDEIERIIRAAPTDSGKGPLTPEVEALLEFMGLFDESLQAKYRTQRKNGTIQYSELKRDLFEAVDGFIAPIRKRAHSVTEREVLTLLRKGCTAVTPLYAAVLERARVHMGLLPSMREHR